MIFLFKKNNTIRNKNMDTDSFDSFGTFDSFDSFGSSETSGTSDSSNTSETKTHQTHSVGSYVYNFYKDNIGNLNISEPDHFYVVLGSVIKDEYPEGFNHIVKNLVGDGHN